MSLLDCLKIELNVLFFIYYYLLMLLTHLNLKQIIMQFVTNTFFLLYRQ